MSDLMQTKVAKIDEVCAQTPVMPVIAVDKLENAVPLAKALVAGGVKVLEVTLRTECAIDAIKAMIAEVPEAIVGAGTIANINDLKAVQDAGAAFAISPGITYNLLEQAKELEIPFLPGIASASELMTGLELGYSRFKLFPATVAGGQSALKAFGGPFPQVRFCPTGGIKESDFTEYLQLKNVMCVGGTWLVPADAMKEQDWDTITEIAARAVKLANASK